MELLSTLLARSAQAAGASHRPLADAPSERGLQALFH